VSSQEDELRPVTALFADVVGSTRLAERLTPAEAKALIGECVNQMSRAVHEYGGAVQAYMGDGICAYFGVPTAREDDPERAARAALRIVEVVREYAADVERAWGIEGFDLRVGINTGQAAVGLVGAVDEQTVAYGDPVNVAARLQSSAEPGTIVVGEQAAHRLSHRFVLEPLGSLAIRGRENEVEVHRLVGAREQEEDHPLVPIVGRDAEVERIRLAADELVRGRGQVVLVVGDAGIGKTRLLEELRAIVGDDAVWLEGRCLSYGDGVPDVVHLETGHQPIYEEHQHNVQYEAEQPERQHIESYRPARKERVDEGVGDSEQEEDDDARLEVVDPDTW